MQNRDGLSLGCHIQAMLTNCAKLKPLNPFDSIFSYIFSIFHRLKGNSTYSIYQQFIERNDQYSPISLVCNVQTYPFDCSDIFVCTTGVPTVGTACPSVPSITLQSSPEGSSPSPCIALVAKRFHSKAIRISRRPRYPRPWRKFISALCNPSSLTSWHWH